MPPGEGTASGFTRVLGTDLGNDHPISVTYNTALATRDGELRAGRQGIGHLIGRVMEAQALESLALNGGTAKDGCNASNYKNKECHYQLDKNNFGDGLVSALKEIAGKASNMLSNSVCSSRFNVRPALSQ